MGEDSEPSADQAETLRPVSHGRILAMMAMIGIGGGIAGFAFSSFKFGLGILVGTALAFANYYWLKTSLRKIFAAAIKTGERPTMLAVKFFLRYVVLAAIVGVLYAADLVSIVALILGLGAFAFAVVIEGFIRIFSKV